MIGPGSLVWNKSIVTIWFYIPTSSTPWLKCLELRLFWTRSVNFCLFWIRVSWSRSRVLIAEFTKTPVITLSTCTTIYLCIWYIHLPVHLSESTPRFICPCFHWHTFISSSPCYLLSCTKKITVIFCPFFCGRSNRRKKSTRLTRHCKAAESDIKVEKLHPYHPHLRGTTRNAVRKWIDAKVKKSFQKAFAFWHLLKQLYPSSNIQL